MLLVYEEEVKMLENKYNEIMEKFLNGKMSADEFQTISKKV